LLFFIRLPIQKATSSISGTESAELVTSEGLPMWELSRKAFLLLWSYSLDLTKVFFANRDNDSGFVVTIPLIKEKRVLPEDFRENTFLRKVL
jgi:hypothetical protein